MPPKHWHMVTLIGADQKGIVAALTRALVEGDANLGETSMVRLGGNFTIMMMVETADSPQALEHRVASMAQSFGLACHVDPIVGQLHAHLEPNIRISIHGADRAGIVADVTSILADHDVNITNLESDVGGDAASPIYWLHIECTFSGDFEALKQSVEGLADSWNVTVRVEEIDTMVG